MSYICIKIKHNEKDKPLYTFANEGLVRVKNINGVMKNFYKAYVLKV
jgi:hypothetical protein